MQLSDFEPEAAEGVLIPGRWRKRSPLVTPSGEFEFSLRAGKDSIPPDEAMLAEINAFEKYVVQHHADVWGMIYENYLMACGTPEHMKSVGVPMDLSAAQIGPYLGPVTLCVVRKKGGFVSAMQANPRWDPEHGLLFSFSDGQLEPVE